MNTTLHQNRPEDMQNWTNLYLEPHDYRIHYVNIDLRHQYGISVAESQTFLPAKRPQRRRARRITDVFAGYSEATLIEIGVYAMPVCCRKRHRTYHGKHRMAYEKKTSAETFSRMENKVG